MLDWNRSIMPTTLPATPSLGLGPARLARSATAIAIATLLGLAASLPAAAQERLVRTITVVGRASEAVPADRARVNLGVEVRGETAEAAQNEVARRASAVVAFLRSRNVEKLQTSGVFLSPIYTTDQRISQFSATNTVSFEVSSATAGEIADLAVKAGATRIDGMQFTAAETAIETARNKALGAAARDAQNQADVVLASLGLSRQEIITLQVDGAYAPPQPMFRGVAAAGEASSPTIGGEQAIQATVTMTVRY